MRSSYFLQEKFQCWIWIGLFYSLALTTTMDYNRPIVALSSVLVVLVLATENGVCEELHHKITIEADWKKWWPWPQVQGSKSKVKLLFICNKSWLISVTDHANQFASSLSSVKATKNVVKISLIMNSSMIYLI